MPVPATVANEATLSNGTILEYTADGGSTWNKVGQIVELTPPTAKVDKVDKSGLETGRTRVKRPGMIDCDDLEGTMIFKASVVNTLANLLTGAADGGPKEVGWRMTYPDGASTGTTEAFTGFLSELGRQVKTGEDLMASFKVACSGPFTFTPGS